MVTDGFADVPDAKEAEKTPNLFATVDAPVKAEVAPGAVAIAPAPAPAKGVLGEPSALAKGHGLVWEIRRALGRERVHGLGWTREQLAFVLKLSVMGARKVEHLGTTQSKAWGRGRNC